MHKKCKIGKAKRGNSQSEVIMYYDNFILIYYFLKVALYICITLIIMVSK